jgi:hypothetical protein
MNQKLMAIGIGVLCSIGLVFPVAVQAQQVLPENPIGEL